MRRGPGNPAKLNPPWKKGESGNPSGTPKGGEGFAARLREMAGEGGKKLAEWLFDIAENAEPGDRLKAIQMIQDRAYGKVKEQVEHSGGLTLEQLVEQSYRGNVTTTAPAVDVTSGVT